MHIITFSSLHLVIQSQFTYNQPPPDLIGLFSHRRHELGSFYTVTLSGFINLFINEVTSAKGYHVNFARIPLHLLIKLYTILYLKYFNILVSESKFYLSSRAFFRLCSINRIAAVVLKKKKKIVSCFVRP